MSKLIDLLTEGHEDYFPLLVGAMESNSDFAVVIERAIQIEAQRDELLAALEAALGPTGEAWASLDHNYYEVLVGRLGEVEEQITAALAKAKGETK